jgi:hypothetical protein
MQCDCQRRFPHVRHQGQCGNISRCSTKTSTIFTLSQLPSQSLDEMVATLLAEEKGTTEDDSQLELAFYARNNHNRSTKGKEEIECHYCKKLGHVTWNCRQRANGVLKGKFKDRQHIASVAMMVDPLEW